MFKVTKVNPNVVVQKCPLGVMPRIIFIPLQPCKSGIQYVDIQLKIVKKALSIYKAVRDRTQINFQ